MANEKLEVAIGEDGSGSNRLIDAVTKLSQKMDKLADSEDKAAKSSKVQGDAASKASVGNNQLANAVDKAKSGFSGLSSALSGVTALLSVSKLISYADTYQGISDKLKLVTTDQKQLNNIIETSYGIAQRNSTGLADTAKLYGNLSSVVKELGKDQKDTAKLTETITQAIALTGPSAEEAKNGLQQFNQGLSAGVLRGDEFNSVVENIPGLAKAIAAGFSSSGPITIGQLRAMAEQGQITGKALVEALERAGPNVAKLAATSTDSVSKAFTRLENAVLKFVGQANQANGGTSLIAKGIDLITNNINIAIPVLTAFVGLLAIGAFAGAITAIANLASGFTILTTGIYAATTAMLANPLIAVGTLAAVSALVLGLKAAGVTFSEIAGKVGAYAGEAGKAAVAATGVTTATMGTVPALTAQAQATASVTTAQTGLNAATVASASASSVAQSSASGLLDIQTKVGKALKDVSTTAASIPPAIQSTTQATAKASSGFTELKMNADGLKSKFSEVVQSAENANNSFQVITMTSAKVLPASMKTAALSLGEFKLSAEALNPPLVSLPPLFENTATSIVNTEKSASSLIPTIVKVADTKAKLAEEAEKARKSMEASTDAMNSGGKGAKEFADRLERLTGAYNNLGEKLETTTEFLQRQNKVREEAKKRVDDSLEGLKKYYDATDKVTSSTNAASSATSNFGITLGDASRASASYGQSLDSAISKLSEYTKAANAAGVAASNASASMSLKQTIKSESGSTDGGGFTNWYYSVTYDGQGADFMPGYGGASLYQKDQKKAQDYLDKLPKGLSIQEAINSVKANAGLSRIIPLQPTNNFAHGGSFTVGGIGGTDSQYVNFMASPNERVTIETPAQQYARDNMEAGMQSSDNVGRRREQPVNFITNIKTDDIDSFKRNRRQISQDLARKLSRA